MSIMLLILIGLVIAVIAIGGIVALVIFLINRNKSQTDGDQNLNERVRSLEIEVHELKSKLDRTAHEN